MMDQATNLRKIIKEKSGKVYRIKEYLEDGSCSPANSPRVVAVTSGKGGVGKTNVVGNLAVACRETGQRVLIFDADLGLANIDIIFGVSPKYTIEDVIKGEKELAQIIVKGPQNIHIIPASSGVQELAHLTEGHKINLLDEFDALNSRFDLLLIDTSAGISSNVIYFNLAAQERIVVVTPEPTSITDAYALMKVMYGQHGTNNFNLLVNMVKNESEAKAVYKHVTRVAARFMASISIDYAGFIPWDKYLLESVSRREPVTCCYPEAPSSHGFKALAKYLNSRNQTSSNDGNIKFFWKSLIAGAMD